MIAWTLVALVVALVVVCLRSACTIYGLEEDLDAAQDAAEALEEERAEAYAEIATLAKERDDAVADVMLLEKRIQALPPAQYKPKHRRPWPTPDHHRSSYNAEAWTPRLEALALGRLSLDCRLSHHESCDCPATYRLFLAAEHESAGAEEA